MTREEKINGFIRYMKGRDLRRGSATEGLRFTVKDIVHDYKLINGTYLFDDIIIQIVDYKVINIDRCYVETYVMVKLIDVAEKYFNLILKQYQISII